MKRLLILFILTLAARGQEFPNPLHLSDGRIVWNPSRDLCLQVGEIVTNITPEQVVTNYPPNYSERLALVTAYLAMCSNLNVIGMEPMAARIALKQRAASETNMATRISIVEAATDLIFLRESIVKLGVDMNNVSSACDVSVTHAPASTNIVYRLREK